MKRYPLVSCSTTDPAFDYHLKLASADELKDAIALAEAKSGGQIVRLKILRNRLRLLERSDVGKAVTRGLQP